MKCDKPGCKLTSRHDHLDVTLQPVPAPEQAFAQANSESEQESEHKTETEKSEGIMGLFADACDEFAGVSESLTGKPSSLRDTARKARKVGKAGEKAQKLGEAVANSKLPQMGKKIIEKVRENARMKEYYK
jgi:hypothetical protein